MRIATIAVVIPLIFLLAACGGASQVKVAAQIIGATSRERTLVRSILERMAPSPVTRVRFRSLQHDFFPYEPHRRMDVWQDGNSVRSNWEETVFAYSYALLARERHIPIGYVSLDIGNGRLDEWLANKPRTPIDDSRLHAFESKLRDAANAAHASIDFRELRPGTVALEATVTAKRPAALLKYHFKPFHDLLTHPPKGLFSFLFSVDDPSGQVALATGAGWTSIRPDLEPCVSFLTNSPVRSSGTPARCPA